MCHRLSHLPALYKLHPLPRIFFLHSPTIHLSPTYFQSSFRSQLNFSVFWEAFPKCCRLAHVYQLCAHIAPWSPLSQHLPHCTELNLSNVSLLDCKLCEGENCVYLVLVIPQVPNTILICN